MAEARDLRGRESRVVCVTASLTIPCGSAMLCPPPKGFPTFSVLKMASPDSFILFIFCGGAAIFPDD